MAAINVPLLRSLRIGFNASIIFFYILYFIFAAIDAAKYGPDYWSSNAGNIPLIVLGAPAGVMILWGAIDLLMHFVGKRNGIPVKGARPALFIFLVGSLAAVITTIVVGDGHAWEETGPNLSKYVGGDQYFWPSWAFALISWLTHAALCVVVCMQGSNMAYMSSPEIKKNSGSV